MGRCGRNNNRSRWCDSCCARLNECINDTRLVYQKEKLYDLSNLQCKFVAWVFPSRSINLDTIILIYVKDPTIMFPPTSSHMSTMERTTQTEPPKAKKWKQIWLCFLGDDKFRRQRQREATEKSLFKLKELFNLASSLDFVFIDLFLVLSGGNKKRYINSVSLIDRSARVCFPMSFTILILLYWLVYVRKK